jgi:protein FRA10AC1
MPPLSTLELPFSYVEDGKHKSALVKTVLCGRCCKRIMWKRRKEKQREEECMKEVEVQLEEEADEDDHGRGRVKGHRAPDGADGRRRRSSRSASPRSRQKGMHVSVRQRH